MRFSAIMSWLVLAAIIAAMFNLNWGLVLWFISLVFLIVPWWSKPATKIWFTTLVGCGLAFVIPWPKLSTSPMNRLLIIVGVWSLLYLLSIVWYSKAASRTTKL